MYNLPGLSSREFILLKHRISLQCYSLRQILFEPKKIIAEIPDKVKPLNFFEKYLKYGYYPFFIESERNYHDKLTNILNLVIESDLPTIFKWLSKDTFGINYLNKPDKLYLNNTNLMYALSSEKPDTGNLRETFILNQLLVKHKVTYPEMGDFLVDGKYLVEVGGPSKKTRKIANFENAFIAADDIEFPDGRKIPLWLFGFLY